MKVLLLCMAFATVSMAMPVAEELKSDPPATIAVDAAPVEEEPQADSTATQIDENKSKLPDFKRAVETTKPEEVAKPEALPELEKKPNAALEVKPDEESKAEEAAVVSEITNKDAKPASEESSDMKSILDSATDTKETAIIPTPTKKIDLPAVAKPDAKKSDESASGEKEEKATAAVAAEPTKQEKPVELNVENKPAKATPEAPKVETEAPRVVRGAGEKKAPSVAETPKEEVKDIENKVTKDGNTKPEEPAKVEDIKDSKTKPEEPAKVEDLDTEKSEAAQNNEDKPQDNIVVLAKSAENAEITLSEDSKLPEGNLAAKPPKSEETPKLPTPELLAPVPSVALSAAAPAKEENKPQFMQPLGDQPPISNESNSSEDNSEDKTEIKQKNESGETKKDSSSEEK